MVGPRGLLLAVGACWAGRVLAGENNHKYTPGERMTVWVNKVGPYFNPQETYPYYRLPFCRPDMGVESKRKRQGMGEILAGNDLRDSGFSLQFNVNQPRVPVCKVALDAATLKTFRRAVEENYWYNMYIDDLPLWGMVGRMPQGNGAAALGGEDPYIYLHRKLSILYNGNRVIEVMLLSENLKPLVPGAELEFSFEVSWTATTKSFEDRFNRYLDYDFFEHQIHWFSIFNSFMMVIFLCGLVALILLRTLRNDFAKYTRDEQVRRRFAQLQESGWKQVHGDVFRAPAHLMLFAALYGTGWQIATLVAGVVLFAMAGPLHGDVYEERGEMVTTVIVVYALTAAVAGYGSGSYYRQYFTTPRAEAASQWQRCMLLTVVLLPALVITVLSFLNTVAVYYDTINTIPFMVIVKMALIWLFVAFPLAVVGCMFGRHWGGKASFPCRVNSIARPIPPGPWYTRPAAVIPLTGILPFGSIFIEMYFIFTSFWNYKFYYVYGFMLLVYAILSVVLVCATIVAVYFVLNAENYHWQWISFLASGSTAGYVFLYSIYYFYFKTEMFGFLQISFYFGYMGLFCVALFVLCGTIGLAGSSVFVKQIYKNIKVD
ncbi:putative endomembrane protein 70-like protein [Tribonema minus]|uniref:Transmembrane 9 superfamily member n=1 Tax=Tribonema minus TaxID=303371 RepID=A0A835YQT7_9STRA|nr:putative endomembrane protein 70-like protein [Tribonema minus]